MSVVICVLTKHVPLIDSKIRAKIRHILSTTKKFNSTQWMIPNARSAQTFVTSNMSEYVIQYLKELAVCKKRYTFNYETRCRL